MLGRTGRIRRSIHRSSLRHSIWLIAPRVLEWGREWPRRPSQRGSWTWCGYVRGGYMLHGLQTAEPSPEAFHARPVGPVFAYSGRVLCWAHLYFFGLRVKLANQPCAEDVVGFEPAI